MIWWVVAMLAALGAAAGATRKTGPTRARAKAQAVREIHRRPLAIAVDTASARYGPRVVTTPVLTAHDLAALARSAVYIGPLDTVEQVEEIEALGRRPDSEDSRVRLMQIARVAVSYGLDGDPRRHPPDPDGAGASAWNWKQVQIARAVVEYWTSFATAPKRHNVRLMARDVLHWAREMTVHPSCTRSGFTYEGYTADGVYERNGTDDCATRRADYTQRFARAIDGWANDRGLPTGHRDPDRWSQIPSLGTERDQSQLIRYLRPELETTAIDKMVIWPGGPPSNPADDGATEAAVIVAAIVIAAASGAVL